MTRARVAIPPRKPLTKAEKVAAWNRENGICYLCGKPVPFDGPDVEYDHEDMREISADDSVENQRPTHVRCHKRKTGEHDAPRLAKVRRQEKLTKAKVKKPGGFRGWRKFDGSPVYREKQR